MDPQIWNQVLSRLRPSDRRLRKGLSSTGLSRLESSLGVRLPRGYRSFLEAHDGGWIGDQRIYGSSEIRHLLAMGRDRFQLDFPGDRWRSLQAPYKRFLPFHPASSQSVECLSLDNASDGDEESIIYWICFPWASDPGRIEGIIGVRHIDVDVLTWWQEVATEGEPEIEPTYVDFLDWTLDAVLEAEARHGLEPSNHGAIDFR